MKKARVYRTFEAKDSRHVILRNLRSSDLEGLLRFANAMVEEKKVNRDLGVAAFDSRVTRKFERSFLRTTMEGVRKKHIVSMVASVDEKIVGICTVRRRDPKDLHHTGVLGIVVLDGYRGIGIGEWLMTEVLGAARRAGIWLVELEVIAINAQAMRLYEKLRFQRVGVVPNKVVRDGRNLDIVSMYADHRGISKFHSVRRGRS